jgi:ABC-type branched-subunit amino acid transport system substrate-binding protein
MEDPSLKPSSDDVNPSPQIQQNLEGDDNQAIGEMKGGTAIGKIVGNIIYNYYYREEVKTAIDNPADVAESDPLPCPYRGLFHFGPEDAEYFLGRESFVEELVIATQNRNFIPLLGASGSGKSSVVLAGLVPKLQQAGNWQFTHFRPGSDPFYALAEALVPLYMSESDSTDKITQAGKLAESLKEGTPLARVFSSIQRQNPNDQVLLIADQFEELYTLCTDETTRRKFLDILLAGIAAPADHIPCDPLLVLTMRADFLGNTLSYRPFADVLQKPDLKLLGSMNRTELTEAIEKPAQKLGVTFEAGLVERILTYVEGEPGILPLLEFSLTELWQRRSGKQLTHAAYEAIGEVKGALGRHADREYGKLSHADRERVRRIFIQLVRPGEGAEDTRRITLKAELGEQNWSLVKQLADARLVVTSRNATGQETVEVVHEALIQNWGELRGWMGTDREFRARQERLRVAKRQWQTHDKDEGSLLRGAALAEAEEQLRERPEDLISELDFIERSLQERERIRKREINTAKRILAGSLAVITLSIGIAATLLSRSLLYNEFAYCPTEKGRPGKKIEDTCFRPLKTSGDVGVFLSSTNFHLDRGINAFKKKDYKKAISLFDQAIEGDRTDPIPRIFRNNAKARLRKKQPLKLAVATSIDYYETAAKDVLRGVADAQDGFNNSVKNSDPFLEIVIANDENNVKAAKEVAQELIKDTAILGIIGHHASESTIAAQEIYKQNEIAVISPTSSSSKLDEGNNFFRTVGGTKKSAELYANYIKKKLEILKLDSITIFYVSESDYSEVLKEDIKTSFLDKKSKHTKQVDLASDKLNVKEEIDRAFNNGDKALLIISNVKTNSVAIAIAIATSKKNIERPEKLKMRLISAMSLSEQETIEKGGDAVEGMTLARPCIAPISKSATEIMKKWQLKNEINWRHSSSNDATQAFIQAIRQSEQVTRKKILSKLSESKLGSLSFHLDKNETAGFGLDWDKSDRSNVHQEYCVVNIKKGKFEEVAKMKNGEFVEIDSTTSYTAFPCQAHLKKLLG